MELFNDIIKIINTVEMCDEHKEQLIQKIAIYFQINDKCYNKNTKEFSTSGCCKNNSSAKKCK